MEKFLRMCILFGGFIVVECAMGTGTWLDAGHVGVYQPMKGFSTRLITKSEKPPQVFLEEVWAWGFDFKLPAIGFKAVLDKRASLIMIQLGFYENIGSSGTFLCQINGFDIDIYQV